MPNKPRIVKVPMHFRVKPELVSKLDQFSRSSGLSMTEIVELGVTKLTLTDISLYKRLQSKA